jgi:hypothetical protein
MVDDEEAKLWTKKSLAMSSTILLILRPVMMLYIGRISAGEALLRERMCTLKYFVLILDGDMAANSLQ